MPGRDTTFKTTYRYGFNGKEMDNETYGNGNEYDYGMRIYNPRMGRFFTLDKSKKEYETPYMFSANNPIWIIDPSGSDTIRVSRTETIQQLANGNTHYSFSSNSTIQQAPGHDVIYINSLVVAYKANGQQSLKLNSSLEYDINNGICSSPNHKRPDEIGASTNYWTDLEDKLNAYAPEVIDFLKAKKPASYKALVLSDINRHLQTVSSNYFNAGVALLSVFLPGPAADAKAEEFITIYRSIDEAEAKSIYSSGGRLSFKPGAMEAKQFWLEKEGLVNLQKTDFSHEYTLEIQVPKSLIGKNKVINNFDQPDQHLGSVGTVENADDLNTLNQNIRSIKITKH